MNLITGIDSEHVYTVREKPRVLFAMSVVCATWLCTCTHYIVRTNRELETMIIHVGPVKTGSQFPPCNFAFPSLNFHVGLARDHLRAGSASGCELKTFSSFQSVA